MSVYSRKSNEFPITRSRESSRHLAPKKQEQLVIDTIVKIRAQMPLDKKIKKIFKDAKKKEDDRLNNYTQKIKDEKRQISFNELSIPLVPDSFPEIISDNEEDISNADEVSSPSNNAEIMGYVEMPEKIRSAYNVKKITKENLQEDIILDRLDAHKRPIKIKCVNYKLEEPYSAKINIIGKAEINIRAKSLALSLIRKKHVDDAKNKLIGKMSTVQACMYAIYFVFKMLAFDNNAKKEELQSNQNAQATNINASSQAAMAAKPQNVIKEDEFGRVVTQTHIIDIKGLKEFLAKVKAAKEIKERDMSAKVE